MMNSWNYDSYNPFRSNVIYVTGVEDALNKSNMPNSYNVYFHQDKPIFYRVKVESDGRKYWQEFNYSGSTQFENRPVMTNDLLDLTNRLKAIEDLIFNKSEVNSNESNGQIPLSTESSNAERGSAI